MPEELYRTLEQELKWPVTDMNLVLYLNQVWNGEGPVMKQINELAESRGKVGGLPNCTLDVLQAAYHPQNNSKFEEDLFDFILKETCVLVTGDNGTRLFVDINHDRFKTVNSNGILIPGIYANPIKGEVYLHPESVSGTFVIDGSYRPLMGVEPFVGNYRALASALAKTPIIWTINLGRITDVKCDDEVIRKFARGYVFERDEHHNGDRIGEFGMPTNLFVLNRGLTGLVLIDEKGRVHLANGYGYNERTGCDYESNVHGDGLVSRANLFAMRQGKLFMLDNVYSPEVFSSLRRG
jgi:hypothetical protein